MSRREEIERELARLSDYTGGGTGDTKLPSMTRSMLWTNASVTLVVLARALSRTL